MIKKRVSLKDIASALNVSVTTVSFVLNGKAEEKRLSKDVTKRVLEYADQVNYSPNQIAKSLRTGKSNIIVFMVEDISNTFFAKLARIIEIYAYKKEYKVIFCSNENSDRKTKELLDLFKDRKVDAYIIIPSPGSKKIIKDLADEQIPVVLFDRYFPDLDNNIVIINNEESAYRATRHLIDNRYRNIAFVTIETSQTQMMDRLQGYKTAMKQDNMDTKVLALPYGSKNEQEMREKLEQFLKDEQELEALFFSTNYLTRAGLLLLKETFPERKDGLGIITFDDDDFFQIHTPSISAVAQPLEEIGQTLMDIVFQLLNGDSKNGAVQKVVLDTTLKVRDSSQPRLP